MKKKILARCAHSTTIRTNELNRNKKKKTEKHKILNGNRRAQDHHTTTYNTPKHSEVEMLYIQSSDK